MDDIPFSRNRTSAKREEAIRAAVRGVDALPGTAASTRIATPADVPKLLAFLADPEVNRWIYSLPRPLTMASVEALIDKNLAAHACGEGLLSLNFDEAGDISGYSELRVWPEWAAGEVAGAMRPDVQNKGQGGAGMARTFTWMFETLDLDLLCNTTALDNIRIQKLFQKTGFAYKGDIESVRPDGSTRASQVWEISREAWMAGQAR
ncbi:GNAT family N-acetyltransferase [Henriciella litoralis]|uniref:GNAT family N-acetyltransferase n=1 Tax=Henriciella litoralis TaxID=568102 RepID=UPI0009FFB2DA|nr:GNAT family N-acetyltransferase [Henriciella litoralis]